MPIDQSRIISELEKIGISVNDVYELVNTRTPYPSAVPVLIDSLKEGIEDLRTKEGVIRALAVKEAIGKVNSVLFDEYNKIPKDRVALRWAIGNTIYVTTTKDDLESIVPIVQDKDNGISRQMFVAALGKVKSKEVEDILIKLLDDDEVTPHALEALGKMRSEKAKERIILLTNHPNTLIKKEAQKALEKIGIT